MSNLTQYIRKCKDCQGEILMKNLGGKWAALEKDGSTQHRCKKSINIPDMQNTTPTTSSTTSTSTIPPPEADYKKKEQELTDRIVRMEEEVITLKNKATTLENWIRKINESYVMNQLQ
jgi:hypothetical protein